MHIDHQTKNQHIPVLLREVLQYLAPEKGNRLLDVTAGYGGHAAAILEYIGFSQPSVLVDRDKHAIAQLKKRFLGTNLKIIHDDFASATKQLVEKNDSFDLILADLGVSSPHFDNASRGFSFQNDGPLDMRMDDRSSQTASSLIDELDAESLTALLKQYGEEPRAKRVAQAIMAAKPITTTKQLASVVAKAYGQVYLARSKVHPATKTFQALRIAVNDELGQLKSAIPGWISLLRPGGRLAIISFHSLEDRIVKQTFSEYGGNRYDAEITVLTKRPIIASNNETVLNPRARSAKLRAVVKK